MSEKDDSVKMAWAWIAGIVLLFVFPPLGIGIFWGMYMYNQEKKNRAMQSEIEELKKGTI